jgi:hypothetical protein
MLTRHGEARPPKWLAASEAPATAARCGGSLQPTRSAFVRAVATPPTPSEFHEPQFPMSCVSRGSP